MASGPVASDTPGPPLHDRRSDRGRAVALAALAASLALHLAVMLVPVGSGDLTNNEQGAMPLAARLVVLESTTAVETAPAPMPLSTIPLVPTLTPKRLVPATTLIASPVTSEVAQSQVGVAVPLTATAVPLAALSRLGDLLARWQSEFPIEIAMPVRVYGKMEVPYPPAALERRIEGSVVAWATIHPDGVVEDIQIVEGDAVFREAVTEAIRNGRYYPAANGGKLISYPIALEFVFSLRDATAAAATASTK